MKRKLEDATIKNAKLKAEEKPFNLSAGGGLYLHIRTNSKVWRYNYRRATDSKMQTLTIGTYPEISLKEARKRHEAARALLSRGTDPCSYKQTLKSANIEASQHSFRSIAQEWFNRGAKGWSDSHKERTASCLKRDILPWIGDTNINKVTSSDIIKIVQRVESRGAADTARRVKQYILQVYKYAVTMELAERNPATNIDNTIILKPYTRKHFATITNPLQIGQLLRDMDAYQGSFIVRCALRLSPLVMLRPGELRAAEWSEIDLESGLWSIPIRRMKAPTHIKQANQSSHTVPLSQQAIAIIRELHPLTGRFKYVFPSARGASRCMSENAVRTALRTLGYDNDTITPHGFRGMASSLLNEMGWNPDAIERQLAHKDHNQIRAAYNRAEYLEERIAMMQAWADFLDKLRTGGQVLKFKPKVR